MNNNFVSFLSNEVKVGDVIIGGNNPIRIQSMTNTDTMDTFATVEQSIRMIDAGCELVRITAQNVKAAENLQNIKDELRKRGYTTPLIADIHFNPKAAETAARIVEKVRINPGNYVDKKSNKNYTENEYRQELEKIKERLLPLLKICKENGTAIRIGVNHGSLSDRILNRYGNTPEGMVESAMEFANICKSFDFENLILSLKSSNTRAMIDANRLMVERMIAEGLNYPLHLGVTEAGGGEDGRIKSTVGIGTLLKEGIGNTIRVSLTEAPEYEIPIARKIIEFSKTASQAEFFLIKNYKDYKHPLVISESRNTKADLFINNDRLIDKSGNQYPLQKFDNKQIKNSGDLIIIKNSYQNLNKEDFIIKSSLDYSGFLLDGVCQGIWLDTNGFISDEDTVQTAFDILQATGVRISKTEFIACPSCGRTLFNIQEALEKVSSKTKHLKGLKIAVMGCIVNGPGEMADADYGYIGAGKGKVNLYKKQEVIRKNIEEEKAVEALINLIKENGDWVDELN
ncbi:MAG: (E)-4-hydroxy-3-methylbut-2-enyl-diphosphate synthase [Bacteroidales bacterium]|nr:(E)-4-hydroxy-3-methylbut-2-enyl-diphosphate synthase [Bacteroidales bacterium]